MITLPPDDIAALLTRADGRVHLIGHVTRVGLTAFYAAIEWYWYTPGTPRNRLIDIHLAYWQDIPWAIASLPAGRIPAVRRLAKQLGMHIADGQPVRVGDPLMINAQAAARLTSLESWNVPIQHFPGGRYADGTENLSIFTIENDHGSPVYKNNQRDAAAMIQATGEINDVLNQGIKLTPAQIADYIYGSGAFPSQL